MRNNFFPAAVTACKSFSSENSLYRILVCKSLKLFIQCASATSGEKKEGHSANSARKKKEESARNKKNRRNSGNEKGRNKGTRLKKTEKKIARVESRKKRVC